MRLTTIAFVLTLLVGAQAEAKPKAKPQTEKAHIGIHTESDNTAKGPMSLCNGKPGPNLRKCTLAGCNADPHYYDSVKKICVSYNPQCHGEDCFGSFFQSKKECEDKCKQK